MKTLSLAGNLIPPTIGFGHLQIVYADTELGFEWEFEVQSPDDLGAFGGNWVYESRDHANSSNTPFYGSSVGYEITQLLQGSAAENAFLILSQVVEAFTNFSPEFEYNLLTQNSNSFANTLLYTIGYNLDDIIDNATPTLVLSFPGDGRNVLTDSGVDGGPSNPALVIGGTSGNDTIITGRGNDEVFGYAGNDRLETGAGNDAITPGDGTDTIDGGSGEDVVIYWDASGPVAVGLNLSPLSQAGQSVDQISNVEDAIGSTGDDWMFGDAQDNELAGYDGNDRLEGGGGDDFLFGQQGDDLLRGDAGSDLIDPGDGLDTLTGGAGEDGFVFSNGYGTNRITDFTQGEDFIYLDGTGLTDVSQLAFGTSGGDPSVSFNGTTIIFEDLAAAPGPGSFFFSDDLIA